MLSSLAGSLIICFAGDLGELPSSPSWNTKYQSRQGYKFHTDLNRVVASTTKLTAAVPYNAPVDRDFPLELVEEAFFAVVVKKLEGNRLAQVTLVVKKLSTVKRIALLLKAMAGNMVAVIYTLNTRGE